MYSLNVPLWQVSATFSLGRFILDRPRRRGRARLFLIHIEGVKAERAFCKGDSKVFIVSVQGTAKLFSSSSWLCINRKTLEN